MLVVITCGSDIVLLTICWGWL